MIVSRLYGILILLYPAEFRQQFGQEMMSVFLEAFARSRQSSASFLIRELGSMIVGGLSERNLSVRRLHSRRIQAFLAGGLVAYSIHVALYSYLVPVIGKTP